MEIQLAIAALQLAAQFAPYVLKGVSALVADLEARKADGKVTLEPGELRKLAEFHRVDLDHVTELASLACKHPAIAKKGAWSRKPVETADEAKTLEDAKQAEDVKDVAALKDAEREPTPAATGPAKSQPAANAGNDTKPVETSKGF